MANTRWKDLYNHLKSEGFEVYSPGQKRGECTKPYIVIKDSGITGLTTISTNRQLFDIMCYVPETKYSTLEEYVNSVKVSMDKIFPLFRPMNYQTPSYLDETVKGHMIDVQYCNYQKKERR